MGDGVGGGMGGGEESGPTGPVTVRKLLFRDGSLFAGDEAGSLCRFDLIDFQTYPTLLALSGGLLNSSWRTRWNTTQRSGAWQLTRPPRCNKHN